jgi:hypothetical protein
MDVLLLVSVLTQLSPTSSLLSCLGSPDSDQRPIVRATRTVQRLHLEVPSSLPRNAIERNLQNQGRSAKARRNSKVYITDWSIFAPQSKSVGKPQATTLAPPVQPASGLKVSQSYPVPRSPCSTSASRTPLAAVTRASSERIPPPAYARSSLRTYFTCPGSVPQSKSMPNHLPPTYYSLSSSPSLRSPPTTPKLPYAYSTPAIRVFSPSVNKDYSLDSKFASEFNHQRILDFDSEAKSSSPMGPGVERRVDQYEQSCASPPLVFPLPCYIPTRVSSGPVFFWDPPSPSLKVAPKPVSVPSIAEDSILEDSESCPDSISYAEVFDFAIYLKRMSEQCKSARFSKSLASAGQVPPSRDAPIIPPSSSLASSVTSSQAMGDIVALLDAITEEEVGGRVSADLTPFGWTEKELMTVFA